MKKPFLKILLDVDIISHKSDVYFKDITELYLGFILITWYVQERQNYWYLIAFFRPQKQKKIILIFLLLLEILTQFHERK